jgi:hypothetical protein
MAKPTEATKSPASVVADAEAVVGKLAQRREQIVAERTAAVDRTGTYAYDAHVKGDEKALAALHEDAATVLRCDTALREIDHAAAEANRQLVIARQAEAAAQDKAKAAELRKLVKNIGDCLCYADAHFAKAVEALNAVNGALDQVHAAGSAYPTSMQLASNCERALKTMLMGLPRHWTRDFSEFLSPADKRTFSGFWERMAEPIEQRIRERLGENERDKTEHAA